MYEKKRKRYRIQLNTQGNIHIVWDWRLPSLCFIFHFFLTFIISLLLTFSSVFLSLIWIFLFLKNKTKQLELILRQQWHRFLNIIIQNLWIKRDDRASIWYVSKNHEGQYICFGFYFLTGCVDSLLHGPLSVSGQF